MKTLARPALRSAATSISTMAGVRIRALTERHPIKPTSPRCHSAWQLNLGRHSTYRRGKSVQTTGATSGWRLRPERRGSLGESRQACGHKRRNGEVETHKSATAINHTALGAYPVILLSTKWC